jgi:hypothetical protein
VTCNWAFTSRGGVDDSIGQELRVRLFFFAEQCLQMARQMPCMIFLPTVIYRGFSAHPRFFKG